MRAAIYARVSTKQQAEKEASIPEQVARCKELGLQLGATSFVEYIDDGYSGADSNRPGMRRLLRDVQNGEFELVLCYSVDRWARDLADQLVFAREVERHARLEFVTHRKGDSPEDQLFFQIKGGFAEYERALIRARTMMGKRKKAEKGQIVIPKAPYGYRYNGNKLSPCFEVYEPEATVVRNMFRWVAEEGLGIGSVALRLTREGVPSPKGKKWGTSTVGRILHNPVYKGEFYNFKWKVMERGETKRSYVRRDPEEWICVRVPAIVSAELWERVQEVIRRNGV